MLNSVLPYEKINPDDCVKERIVVQFSQMNSKLFVNEAYCVNPACSCTEVVLTFIELSDDGRLVNEWFTIKVDMNGWKVTDKKRLNKKLAVDEMVKEFMKQIDELKEKQAGMPFLSVFAGQADCSNPTAPVIEKS